MHLHDEFEQVRRDRQPLLLVRIEQRGRRAMTQHMSELPAEIVGVLHAGVHALPAGRRMNVRGVAHQEHAANLEVLRHAAARAERRSEIQFGDVELGPPGALLHQRTQRLQ